MDEENLDLGYLYPDFHLNQATLDRIDRALLAVAGRVREVTGDTTPQVHEGALPIPRRWNGPWSRSCGRSMAIRWVTA